MERGWLAGVGARRLTRLARLEDDAQHGVPLGPPPWARSKADLISLIALAARLEHLTGVEAQVAQKLVWEVMPDTLCYPSPDPRTLRRQRQEWSVRRLAGEIGRHPRTWQKAIASLRKRGLVKVYDRNQRCGLENGYEFVLDAWINLGRVLLGETRLRHQPPPVERARRSPGPALPKWAVGYARQLGRTAEQLVAVTLGALQACLPALDATPSPRQLKDLGRRMLWLWRAMGPEVPVAEVVETARRIWRAACRSGHYIFRELRDDDGRRALKRPWGQSPLHDLRRAFSQRTKLHEVVEAANDWHRWHGHAEPGEEAPVLIPEGQAGALDWAADDVDTLWAVARATVAERLDAQDFAIWVAPLQARCVQDGALVLEAPNAYYRDWCADNYLGVLSQAVDGPVGFVVASPGPPGPADGVDPPPDD